MQQAVPARRGALWDGRFRLGGTAAPPDDARFGAVGEAAARLRHASDLPASVLQTLPALWVEDRLIAVPHIDWPDPASCARVKPHFAPARPAAPASSISS
jgi:tRNA(Ile)-lysidine synthase